ncbi:MAG: hypothetical protein BMS9Abin11_1243 [Gammaproteobacteria bacterium]|nr:MAG: hypothetical protein BMS9Abin11_1243 [Gammaproteobacteria bacterium]
MHWYLDVLKKYAVFDGRAQRTEYWMFFLFNIIISIILTVIENAIGLPLVLSGLYFLAILLPSIGVAIRRLHDTGRSGWWLLIALIPFVGIVLLIFMVLDSQSGDNEYGPNPKSA